VQIRYGINDIYNTSGTSNKKGIQITAETHEQVELRRTRHRREENIIVDLKCKQDSCKSG